MYLVGAEHPHKDDALRILDELILRRESLAVDAEALQEILHRYTAIDRIDAIQPAFDAVLDIVDDVLPVGLEEVEGAKEIVMGRYGISARDALHVAVMRAHDIVRIVSFDVGFDRVPGIERLS